MSKEEQQSLLLASVSARNDTGSPMFPLFPITPWQRRDVILFILESLGWVLFSVTFSFLFVLPLCGMIFRCDCIWEWDTSEKCTVMMRRETCPFCGRGNGGIVSTSLIPQWGVVPLMVGAALLMRYYFAFDCFLFYSLLFTLLSPLFLFFLFLPLLSLSSLPLLLFLFLFSSSFSVPSFSSSSSFANKLL